MEREQYEWLQTLTGARVRIVVAGSDTENRLTLIDFVEPVHSLPPVYTRHEFIEVFNVVSGTLLFQFPDEPAVSLSGGESITCPSYRPHSFWNESDEPAKVQLICSPAGLDQFFIESDALLKSAGAATDVNEKKRKALRRKYGLEHLPAAPLRG